MRPEQKFSSRTWLAAILGTALSIAVGAGWSTYSYGNMLDRILNLPKVPLLIGGVFLMAFASMALRGVVHLANRWRKRDSQPPAPGLWPLVWASFQMACLVALLALGAAALASIPLGHSRQFFQAFMLVMVSSGVLFLAGAAVRDISRIVRSLR